MQRSPLSPQPLRGPIKDCIDKWARYVESGMKCRGDERYMELHYEDLVQDYENSCRKICDHVGVDWSDDLLRREELQGQRTDVEIVNPEVRGKLYQSSMGRWKKDLSDSEKVDVEKRAGALLRSLGYK